MATVTLNTIKNWFKTGLKPTQAQFWDAWDSFRHKSDGVPAAEVAGLDALLAGISAAQALLLDLKENAANKGEGGGYAPLDEFAKLPAEYLNIVDDLTTGGATALASAETVKTLKGLIDGINVILASDNIDLDNVQELVDAIETIQLSLSTILVNDLTTGGTTKALTAQMGVELYALINGLNSSAATLATDQIFSGIKTFLTGKLGLRNVNNTFTSFFTNSNTASRTYTLQDKSGTIAHLDDVFSKTYNTYFINTATGNNATGVFEDASKPFQNIDYVNANFTITDGTIFYLQGTGQTYAINNQLQAKKQSFIADDNSTNILDFSGNSNQYIIATTANVCNIKINLPSGTLRCERSGGTGVIFQNYGNGTALYSLTKEIYWNTSTNMTVGGGFFGYVRVLSKITCRVPLCQTINEDVFIPHFVCLANGASYTTGYDGANSAPNTIKINRISGAGSFTFYAYHNYIIGDILTTGACSPLNSTTDVSTKIEFNNSIITNGGFQIPAFGIGLVLSGVIKSVSSFSNLTGGGVGILKFVNFTADFGTNNIKVEAGKTISFENCSIKSTNSPLGVFTNTGTGTFIIKNCAFEVVNAVPLMTGGAGGTRTLTIAGVSTNATMLSDQNGTGVTVTQYTNY